MKKNILLLMVVVAVLHLGCTKTEIPEPTQSPAFYEINGDTTVCYFHFGSHLKLKLASELYNSGDTLVCFGAAQRDTIPFSVSTVKLTLMDTGVVHLDIYQLGDVRTVSIQLIICWHLAFFPTAFTPNGDGRNDLWKPTFTQVRTAKWEVRTLHNDFVAQGTVNSAWDGTWQGEAAPQGNYQYFATYTTWANEEIEKNGLIQLIR